MIVAAIAYFGRPYYDGLIAQAMPTISQMLPRLAEISPNIAVPTLDINVPIIASPTKEDATTKTLPSLIRFDIPCKASMLVRRTDGSVVSWAMDMRVVSVEVLQDTLKLNFEIVRTGSTQQQWSPVNANDIKLKTETGRFLLKTEDGASDLFTQNTTLRPNEVHQGWLAFDQPDRGVFELVHPNVKPRFLIDLTHRQCQTI